MNLLNNTLSAISPVVVECSVQKVSTKRLTEEVVSALSEASLEEIRQDFLKDEAAKERALELLTLIKNELCADKSKKMRQLPSQVLVLLVRLVSELSPSSSDQSFLLELQKVLIRNCGRRLWQATIANLDSLSKSFTKAGIKDRDLQAMIHQVMFQKLKQKK